MSQLREDMLEDMNRYLIKWRLISLGEEVTNETAFPLCTFDPEKEGRFIIYLEEKWKVSFERITELREKQLMEDDLDPQTFGELISLIIKLMNEIDPIL